MHWDWTVLGDGRIITGLLVISAVALVGSSALIAVPTVPWRLLTSPMQGRQRMLAVTVAGIMIAMGIILGLVIPAAWRNLLLVLTFAGAGMGAWIGATAESRRHRRQQRRVRLQTLDLARYLAVRLETSMDGDLAILRAYLHPPRRAADCMQDLVLHALDRHRRMGRGSVWEALHQEAQTYAAPELTTLTGALVAVADQDRRQIATVAKHAAQQLSATLLDELRQRMQRSELLLTMTLAGSLVFGLLAMIVYVMTGGLAMVDDLVRWSASR